MPPSRRFTRPQGKKLTGVAKSHARPALVVRLTPDGRRSSPVPSARGARRILVADVHAEAVATTAFALVGAAYRVSTVLTADETLRALRRERYDLIVLGAMLGEGRGIEILRTLRSHTRPDVFGTQTQSVGVMMLLDEHATDREALRDLALSQGADDVLTRPFSARELLLRTASILRRATNAPADSPDVFRLEELYIDFAGHHVMVEDEIVDLTRKEFALLRTLADNVGQLCTRSRLGGRVDDSPAIPSRTIDMQISRLRRKIGTAARMIENVRGEGYRLDRVRPRVVP